MKSKLLQLSDSNSKEKELEKAVREKEQQKEDEIAKLKGDFLRKEEERLWREEKEWMEERVHQDRLRIQEAEIAAKNKELNSLDASNVEKIKELQEELRVMEKRKAEDSPEAMTKRMQEAVEKEVKMRHEMRKWAALMEHMDADELFYDEATGQVVVK